MSGGRVWLGSFSGLLVLLAPALGYAQGRPHPHVTLAIDSCLDADPDEMRRIVGIELGALLTTDADPNTTAVSVQCREGLTDLAVRDPLTGKSLTRSIDASQAPAKGKARLVALAIAELVAASWVELESNPHPVVAPASPPPSPDERAAALDTVRDRRPPAPPASRVRLLGVLGQRSVFSDAGMTSFGLGARVGYERASGFGASIDLLADEASVDASLGTVTVDSLSTGPSASLSQTWGILSTTEALGARFGIARVTGEAAVPDRVRNDTLVSPWGGPFGGLGARVRIGGSLVIELAGEAGYALFPMSAIVDGRREVSIRSLWLGAQLGVGVVL